MGCDHNSNDMLSELDKLDGTIVAIEAALKMLRDRRDKIYIFLDQSTKPPRFSLKELLEHKRRWASNNISSSVDNKSGSLK